MNKSWLKLSSNVQILALVGLETGFLEKNCGTQWWLSGTKYGTANWLSGTNMAFKWLSETRYGTKKGYPENIRKAIF